MVVLHIYGTTGFSMANLRKTRNVVPISTEPNSSKSLNELVAELTKRLANLESRVEALESNEPADLLRALTDEPPPQRRRGRKQALRTPELLERHYALIYWLEDNWPEISLVIRRARSVDEVIAALKKTRGLGTHPYQPEFYQNPERYKEQLWAFLKSEKYGGDPRQLAAAMAGLPYLSSRTSFDKCSQFDTDFIPINPRALRDHLRRKFSERLRELARAQTTSDVKRILAKSNSKELAYRQLRANPERVLSWLKSGQPKTQH